MKPKTIISIGGHMETTAAKGYQPLVMHEGRVAMYIRRSPYLSKYTWWWWCDVCGDQGHHQPRQRLAIDDAYEHINENHARMAHPES